MATGEKYLYKLVTQGKARASALDMLEVWHMSKGHTRWLPIGLLSVTGYCELTIRQAEWIMSTLKRLHKIEIKLEIVDIKAETKNG